MRLGRFLSKIGEVRFKLARWSGVVRWLGVVRLA